jgi:hypothetical protein
MTIEVADGAASIAHAEVISGPCSRLLFHSAVEAGPPIGYATVQVTYNGPSDIPPLCLIQLTSLDGETVVVTASASASSYQQTCCPTGSCCLQSSAISLHHRVVFDQAVQTVSFPGLIDGGVVDGGEADTAQDVPQTTDSDSVDLAEGIEAGSVDAADEDALDGGTNIDVSIDVSIDL